MRTQADRDASRAKRESTMPVTTKYPGEAATLRLLGHVGVATIDRAAVVTWTFPASARADAERCSQETRHAFAERWQLFHQGS